MNYLFAAILAFMVFTKEWIHSPWFALATVTIGIMSYQLKDRWLGAALFYTVTSSAMILFYNEFHESSSWGLAALTDLQVETAKALAIILLFYCLFHVKDAVKQVNSLLVVTGFVNPILSIGCWIIGHEYYGLGINPSNNSMIIALNLFFVLNFLDQRYVLRFILLSMLAIVLQKGMIGMISLCIGSLVYLYMTNKTSLKKFLVVLLIGFSGFVFTQGFDTAFSFSNREKIWKETLSWIFLEGGRPEFGYAPGSYYRMMPRVQLSAGTSMDLTKENSAFILAHNDFLQLLFDTGLVGLILWSTYFFRLTRKALYKSAHLFSFLIAYLISALGNYPSHVMLTSLMLVLTMKELED